MKNVTILIIALLTGIIMPSCKKEYLCKCTKTYTGPTSSATYDDDHYTYRDTRSRAADRCNQNERTGTDLGGSYTRNCDIE